jgi:hypothetical protein
MLFVRFYFGMRKLVVLLCLCKCCTLWWLLLGYSRDNGLNYVTLNGTYFNSWINELCQNYVIELILGFNWSNWTRCKAIIVLGVEAMPMFRFCEWFYTNELFYRWIFSELWYGKLSISTFLFVSQRWQPLVIIIIFLCCMSVLNGFHLFKAFVDIENLA